MTKTISLVFFATLCTMCQLSAQQVTKINDSLEVIQIRERVWIHVSGQSTPSFGRFTSNGAIYISGKEAIIMDTPPSLEQSQALLDWVHLRFPDVVIKAVIINHFHNDCLGGLAYFHERGITSLANERTVQLLAASGKDRVVPQRLFRRYDRIKLGDKYVESYYPGTAHTEDNIVTWIPEYSILFGGCMVKALQAGKGNVSDANVRMWPKTIKRLIKKYSAAEVVIPGHGVAGGSELLEYTRDLFSR